jgi:hypothetical protein
MEKQCRIQKVSASTSCEQGETAPARSLNAAYGASETGASNDVLASASARLTTLQNSKVPPADYITPSGKSHATATVIQRSHDRGCDLDLG